MPHRRLIDAVLALYPRPIRERYGAEIADLLANSPTPVRDLADVTWCALRDRLSRGATTLTVARVRTGVLTLASLLLAPLGLTIALVIAMVATGPAMNLLVAYGVDFERTASVVYGLTAVPVGPLAWWLGRRLSRTATIPADWVLAPATLAVGLLAVATLPRMGTSDGETHWASTLAILCWCVGTAVLCRLLRTARGHGRIGTARLTAVLGGLGLLTLSTAVYVWTALEPFRAPRGSAPLWYLSAMTGVDPGLVDGTYLQLSDAVGLLPAMLTACTVFAFGLTARLDAARRTPAGRPVRPTAAAG